MHVVISDVQHAAFYDLCQQISLKVQEFLNAHAPITTAFRILSDGKQHQLFLVPTHPPKSTCQVLSRGQSTPHISALVQCTLKTALKLEGYITLLM